MKKLLLLLITCHLSLVTAFSAGNTPVQNAQISGTSALTSGTFNIQTGVVFTALSGSTIDLSAGTLTLATNQIGWTKVSKSGSSLADLATRAFLNLSDAPASYSGAGGKIVAVKSTADGLEFVTAAGGGNVGVAATIPATTAFTYASNGDTNGIFYFLGTNFGADSWSNPNPALLTITSNGLDLTYSQPIANLTDRANGHVLSNGTGGASAQFFSFDLGVNDSLVINHYTLQMRDDAVGAFPASWKLQESDDGTTFTDIQTDSFAFSSLNQINDFAVAGQTVAHRYWRLKLISNSISTGTFNLGEVEIYGAFTYEAGFVSVDNELALWSGTLGTQIKRATGTGLVKITNGVQSTAVSGSDFVSPLIPTAVKTSAYAAAASEYVPVDASVGTVTITLPTAPPDGTRVGVKLIAVSGANTAAFALGGSDVFNKAGGSTTGSISLLNQGVIFQYKASTHIWYGTGSDLPLSQLDARYPLTTDARFSDTRTPTDATVTDAKVAAGGLTNAAIATAAAIAESKLSLATDAAAGTGSRRTLGSGATQAAAGNDARFSDTRTPIDASVTAAKVAASLKPSGSAATSDEALRAIGTTASTAAAGNDARLSDTRVATTTATNDNAAAGRLGEFINSAVTSGSPVAATTGTAVNVTSLSLTAGDWDVRGNVGFIAAGTTSVTNMVGGISLTTGAFSLDVFNLFLPAYVPGAVGQSFVVPSERISLASTTTVFLVARSAFTVAGMSVYGSISARRVR
jgi:hypothetical protein